MSEIIIPAKNAQVVILNGKYKWKRGDHLRVSIGFREPVITISSKKLCETDKAIHYSISIYRIVR